MEREEDEVDDACQGEGGMPQGVADEEEGLVFSSQPFPSHEAKEERGCHSEDEQGMRVGAEEGEGRQNGEEGKEDEVQSVEGGRKTDVDDVCQEGNDGRADGARAEEEEGGTRLKV